MLAISASDSERDPPSTPWPQTRIEARSLGALFSELLSTNRWCKVRGYHVYLKCGWADVIRALYTPCPGRFMRRTRDILGLGVEERGISIARSSFLLRCCCNLPMACLSDTKGRKNPTCPSQKVPKEPPQHVTESRSCSGTCSDMSHSSDPTPATAYQISLTRDTDGLFQGTDHDHLHFRIEMLT